MNKVWTAVVASVLFFILLVCWAFAAPIGAGPDSDFHISSIWCGQGERDGLCEELGWYETGYQARVPFMFQMCDGRPIEFLPTCPEITAQPDSQFLRTAPPHQQSLYYKVMSYVATKNPTQSILVMRSINAFIASSLFCAILILGTKRVRIAVVGSWTVGLVPVGVQFFSNVNPRGWSFLAVFSAWAFLASALELPPKSHQRYFSILFCVISASLAFASRIDGSAFVVFSCAIVAIAQMLKSYVVSKKAIYISALSLLITALIIRSIDRLSFIFDFSLQNSISVPRFMLMQLVHGPEFVAQAWGYNVGQQGNGPGIVGIIGLSLFALTLVFSLQKASIIQSVGTSIIAAFITITLMRGSMAIGELVPASGEYVLALTVFLLGFAIWMSNSENQFHTANGRRVAAIALLSFSHAVAYYSYMEFYVKRGSETGSFKTISLDQIWWWDSSVSPNLVYWIGSLTFLAFMGFIWSFVLEPSKVER